MNLPRLALRCLLGRRAPILNGEKTVIGLTASVVIRRDAYGIPHIDAETAADGWFGLGFCHGQDRGFQLETLLRVSRGTLAELVGPGGLPIDRLSRRIGFHRSAIAQLPAISDTMRTMLTAYTAGVSAGATHGVTAKPHEFALLGGTPTAWQPADVLAFLKLQSFLLPSNWDRELARLRILLADGPDALRALDTAGTSVDPYAGDQNAKAAIDALMADFAQFAKLVPLGGGSNNWAIAGSRSASGKPLLANDPHLPPSIPPPWYLASLRTPGWTVAGASFVGGPGFPVGHNGHACWGVTAGLTDTTDLFLETIGSDGVSVRETDGRFATCEVVREVIRVKGKPDVVEEVLVTPRGPIVSGVLPTAGRAVSIRGVWLDPLPVGGFLDAVEKNEFHSFRECFAAWPVLPQNLLYADAAGTIGWQLIGQIPVRKSGHGLLPLPADAPNVGWEPDLVPFRDMPFRANPPTGFLATANQTPHQMPENKAFLGLDYCDGYRVGVIADELGKRTDWTVADCQQLQLSKRSLPWEEIRDSVLSLMPTDVDNRQGLNLIRGWDGVVAAESPAACLYELWLAEMTIRIAKAKAPKEWKTAVGGSEAPFGHSLFAERTAHTVNLLRTQPADWFPRPWADEMLEALGSIVRHLRKTRGPGPDWWQWGDLRPLAIHHAILGKHRLLGPAFNLPTIPFGGDPNTVAQAGSRPLAPTAPPHMIPNLRAVFDCSDFTASRFALAGGQSGNPTSSHYDDLFPYWLEGQGVPIPYDPTDVLKATVATLRLKAIA